VQHAFGFTRREWSEKRSSGKREKKKKKEGKRGGKARRREAGEEKTYTQKGGKGRINIKCHHAPPGREIVHVTNEREGS